MIIWRGMLHILSQLTLNTNSSEINRIQHWMFLDQQLTDHTAVCGFPNTVAKI